MICFILLSLLIVCSISLFISIKKNLELFDRLQQLDDSLQLCVKVLQEQIEKLEVKTKIEVFSDEPVIREMILDMSTAKESVAAVSRLIDDLVEKEQDDLEDE